MALGHGSVTEAPRKPQFRVSSLPFCPILYAHGQFKAEPRRMTYKDQFYFDIGHALHRLWQRSMVQSPIYGERVYGRWKCARCQKPYSENLACFRPASTPRCCNWSYWEYEELELEWGGLSGHPDLFVRYDEGWAIHEFKTTSYAILSSATRRHKTLPFVKHFVQADSYAYLTPKLYPDTGRVTEVVITYGSRENPDPAKFFRFPYAFTDALYDSTRERLYREREGYAMAQDWLAKPESERRLKALVAARPCHSKEQYEERMDKSRFDKCPFFDKGICAKPSIPLVEAELTRIARIG